MTTSLIPLTRIEQKILLIRGQKVLFDFDLAELYGVPTFRLNEQIKRNQERFPKHFMFQLTKQELIEWRSQFAISNPGVKMGLRRPPYAFTEHGTLQAANVLNSPKAIKVGITVIEAFIKLRALVSSHSTIMKKLENHEQQIGYLFDLLKDMASPTQTKPYSTHKIGFMREEGKARSRKRTS